ncbi:MAG: prepilin-type N-terminal cleavage/methylation domain-containing protein [Sumerlaeia bacterium]
MFRSAPSRAFTLIELLIVVAIIAILAAIAVPNFLEAQIRAKVSRALSDMRTIETAVESYRVDFNKYPEGSDSASKQPLDAIAFLDQYGLTAGYYTFALRNGALTAGSDFASLTTPIAYVTTVPRDVFAEQVGGPLTYQFRNAKDLQNGWIMTSFGPDADVLDPGGIGTTNTNPLSTASDTGSPARLGDVNERAVIHYIEQTDTAVTTAVDTQFNSLDLALADLTYDPTNGTVSDGDLIRYRK